MTANASITPPTNKRLAVQAEPLLVSAKDAARLCGISERLWRSWNSSGKCPKATLDGTGVKRWRFDEIRDWVQANCPSRARWDAMSAVSA